MRVLLFLTCLAALQLSSNLARAEYYSYASDGDCHRYSDNGQEIEYAHFSHCGADYHEWGVDGFCYRKASNGKIIEGAHFSRCEEKPKSLTPEAAPTRKIPAKAYSCGRLGTVFFRFDGTLQYSKDGITWKDPSISGWQILFEINENVTLKRNFYETVYCVKIR